MDGSLRPVTGGERILALDTLRGVAVLGILLMNITAFGLPYSYEVPNWGGSTGANLAVWAVSAVLFEGTMRGLFSLMFGASIVLLVSRLEARGAGIEAADIYYRRIMWLILFGLAHWLILLWIGDVLFNYGLIGLFLFAFRKARPRLLFALAGGLLLAGMVLHAADRLGARHDAEVAERVAAAGTPEERLSEADRAAVGRHEDRIASFRPSRGKIAEELELARNGNYFEQLAARAPTAFEWQWVELPHWALLDIAPMMLIGIALLRLGVLTGERGRGFYLRLMLAGYAVGLPVNLYEAWLLIGSGFAFDAYQRAMLTYELGRVATTAGHLGLVMLVATSGWLPALARRLAAVGQMALSNYVGQTIICTGLFLGFGLGLYGRLERYELYFIVAAIWALQLIVSPIWLRHCRFGPLEWLWRSLTYWRRQPMRRTAPALASGAAPAE